MKTQSAKQKGRLLQQWVRDLLMSLSPNLEDGDIESRSMGSAGEDLMMSPSARKVWPFSIECKSRAAFVFYKDLDQAKSNCPEGAEPLLVCKANRKDPVVIVDAKWFFSNV